MIRLISTLVIAAVALAQPNARRMISPEVLPDHHITFRISALKATEVVLKFGEADLQLHPMAKGEDGVWSVTIGPIEPEIYSYSFLVDGTKMIDLTNPIAKIGATIDTSIVEVPGNPPRFDQVQQVPHGSINIHTYQSNASNVQRSFYIYVPPGYYSQPNKRFPVLYLWHGGGGAELEWSTNGRAGVIMDNLIAQEKTIPMLVVMPNNAAGAPAPGVMAASRRSESPRRRGGGDGYAELQRDVLEDLIPYVAKHYRTIENRENRAMAGLSAGGGTTMNVGFGSLDEFAWLAEFSSGIFGGVSGYGGDYDIEKVAPPGIYADPEATNKRIKLFYMSCGTEDPRMPFQKKAAEDFRSHKLDVTFAEFAGGHEWIVWRHSLADLAPRLFR